MCTGKDPGSVLRTFTLTCVHLADDKGIGISSKPVFLVSAIAGDTWGI